MKILIFAPHPDDEVLGCGGTILKHRNKGDEVYICFVTKATSEWSEEFRQNRPKEIEAAGKILDTTKNYFLNFETVKLDTIPQKDLNLAIKNMFQEIRPEILYLPHKGDLNKDHRLVFEAALVATRPTEIKVKKILSYETLSETEWGSAIRIFKPNIYENIEENFDKKIKAMKAYSSEIKPYPHPRSLEIIEALAKKRGSEAGFKYAEAFELIREINN